jgi:hypothetical protein
MRRTSGLSLAHFEPSVRLVTKHRIELDADVRLSPYSRYVQHFNREELRPAIEEVWIQVPVGKLG